MLKTNFAGIPVEKPLFAFPLVHSHLKLVVFTVLTNCVTGGLAGRPLVRGTAGGPRGGQLLGPDV